MTVLIASAVNLVRSDNYCTSKHLHIMVPDREFPCQCSQQILWIVLSSPFRILPFTISIQSLVEPNNSYITQDINVFLFCFKKRWLFSQS